MFRAASNHQPTAHTNTSYNTTRTQTASNVTYISHRVQPTSHSSITRHAARQSAIVYVPLARWRKCCDTPCMRYVVTHFVDKKRTRLCVMLYVLGISFKCIIIIIIIIIIIHHHHHHHHHRHHHHRHRHHHMAILYVAFSHSEVVVNRAITWHQMNPLLTISYTGCCFTDHFGSRKIASPTPRYAGVDGGGV